MNLSISKDAVQLGKLAAEKVSQVLVDAVKTKGSARMIVSTGASQFEFFKSLIEDDKIPWSKIEVFHLDEYINLPPGHKASFRKYLNERFISVVKPGAFYEVKGEGDISQNISELSKKLLEKEVDIGVIGIGENAHIAFNDPPANFDTEDAYIVVELDQKCKEQQVNEGWFENLEQVPTKAITMSVHRIMQSKTIVSVVPHKEKAWAIEQSLTADGPDKMIPATILKTHPNWFLYLDENSSALLSR